MDIRFDRVENVNGRPSGLSDVGVFVEKTTEVFGHWQPSPDAFGPDDWTHIGWVTRVSIGRFCFLKIGTSGWGPARTSREQSVLAVLL